MADRGGGGFKGGKKKKKGSFKNFGKPEQRKTSDHTLRAVNPIEFAEARAAEIGAMITGLSGKGGTKRMHQTLPRHMRRRAMSHNVKRLPVRCRESAAREMIDVLTPAEKAKLKKSRRHRRRPSNLKQEYVRRSDKTRWLDTHIWHAKRFQMRTEWGCRVPTTPCDKSVRATHRAVKQACTIHDASYTGCIELAGTPAHLVAMLNEFLYPKIDLESADGAVEICGNVMLRPGNVRQAEDDGDDNDDGDGDGDGGRGPPVPGFLCPVSVIFEQLGAGAAIATAPGAQRVWLWIHPAAFTDALEVLEAVSAVNPGAVTVTDRQSDLIRFQLAGTDVQSVLRETLVAVGIGDGWDLVSQISDPANLRRRAILAVTTLDPRLRSQEQRASRKQAVVTEIAGEGAAKRRAQLMAQWPAGMAASPLWDPAARAALLASKLSEKALNDRRSDLLVPGTDLPPTAADAQIPIMLVQRPGATGINPFMPADRVATHRPCARGYGSGWDLIAPVGWGMAFWLPLVHSGARAIGTTEVHAIAIERGVTFFPNDHPDSPGGAAHAAAASEEDIAGHARRPPKVRTNFELLKMGSPFQTGWAAIAADWPAGAACMETDYSVIRTADRLAQFVALLTGDGSGGNPDPAADPTEFAGEFVCVQLNMEHKGTPKALSWLYVPAAADLAAHAANPVWSGPTLKAVTDRAHIGALTSARLSLVRGHGFGVGLVSAEGLIRSASSLRVFARTKVPDLPGQVGFSFSVLVRDIISKQCRLARASVCSGTQVFD